MITLEILDQALTEGYCLHGSRHRIAAYVEPRQARCESGRLSSNLLAVYADPYSYVQPCLMAMFQKKDRAQGMRVSYHLGEIVTVKGTNVGFGPGYVYILPRDTFEIVDDEYISRVPVPYTAVVFIDPKLIEFFVQSGDVNLDINRPAS